MHILYGRHLEKNLEPGGLLGLNTVYYYAFKICAMVSDVDWKIKYEYLCMLHRSIEVVETYDAYLECNYLLSKFSCNALSHVWIYNSWFSNERWVKTLYEIIKNMIKIH